VTRQTLAFSLCILLAACGSTNNPGDAGPGSSDSGTSDAGNSDAGNSDAGNSDAGPGDAGPSIGGGIEFSAGAGPDAFFDVVADFASITVTGTSHYSCDTAINGCQYCPPVPTVPADGGVSTVFTFLSAGTLTIDDNSSLLATLSYDADAGVYSTFQAGDDSLSWNPGDSLNVVASGGQIAAFNASVTAPQLLSNVVPALSLTSAITVSLSSPFNISWTPSSDGASMNLVLGADSANGGTISCTGPESLGQFTVAASILANYAGATGGTASLTKSVTHSFDAGAAALEITADAPQATGSVTYTP